jgi:hypothetical protein
LPAFRREQEKRATGAGARHRPYGQPRWIRQHRSRGFITLS